MANSALLIEINRHLLMADDKLLRSVEREITRTISLEYQEGSTQVSVDIMSDGTVSWRICGQQHWEGGPQTEGFLFDKTLREVEDSQYGEDVGLIYEEVLTGLGWHFDAILTIPIADDGLVKILSLDEANYRGLPPHAQQTIKRIRQ